MTQKVPALLTVYAGTFESQPVAFTCLKDAADIHGLSVDLKDVDVVQAASEVRLAHYFRPAIVARIQEAQGEDNTVIVIRPSALASARGLPVTGMPLRLLGRFAGEVVETAGQQDWV